VLYFYEKQEALLQCEVRSTEVADTYAIVLTEPDGRVRTHYVKGSNDAHRLWLALEQQLLLTGWTGPVGQDMTVPARLTAK
jgi:metal-dependent HD superfamily phosphatase/phosphodiesterase